MNLKKISSPVFEIKVYSFNEILTKPSILKRIRKLTLDKWSGMNFELNNFEKIAKRREVNAKIILAYQGKKIVGWALLSRESSKFSFLATGDSFDKNNGSLFEVFIDPKFRRQGIATKLFKVAKRKSKPYKLCVCPWNKSSIDFYKSVNAKYSCKIL